MASMKELMQGPQRFFILLSGGAILFFGVTTLWLGVQARSSDGFQVTKALMEEQSNMSFDEGAAILMILVLGVLISIMGLAACWAAAKESHGVLCCYTFFAIVAGGVLLFMCAGLGTYTKTMWPSVIKTTNRVCGLYVPQQFKSQLNCTAGNVPGPSNATLSRRLMDPEGSGLLSAAGRLLTLRAFADEAMQFDASGVSARRLFPGTTEQALIERTCARLGPICASPCLLIDLICKPPVGFDALKACVCDRSGPHYQTAAGLGAATCDENVLGTMCKQDTSGRYAGAFCLTQTAADHVGEEACFVLPTANCADRGWTKTGLGTSPTISSGPCTDPESRSGFIVSGHSLLTKFVGAAFILGCICVTSALCSFCLFVELYTGQSVGDHGRSLAQDEKYKEQYDEGVYDDDDDFQYAE